MSASTRRRANATAQAYPSAVLAALESDDEQHVDPRIRALPCPVCGRFLLSSCPHPRRP